MTRRRETFGLWLARQASRQDAVGELAFEYVRPCSCAACAGRISRRYSPSGVREELRRHDATPAMLEALEAAEAEWRQAQGAAA